MEKIWATAWAFAVLCIIFFGCKVAGLEWAAERSWTEAIIFLGVSVVIIVCFFLRKKIAALYNKIKDKIS
ncbi:MAG: hypothetical protein E7672_04825 [Ruminococcaceae bacterium]|nr:hypothetical protein [Oscillospiraceae bacterium]